jgi:hypothetical protein
MQFLRLHYCALTPRSPGSLLKPRLLVRLLCAFKLCAFSLSLSHAGPPRASRLLLPLSQNAELTLLLTHRSRPAYSPTSCVSDCSLTNASSLTLSSHQARVLADQVRCCALVRFSRAHPPLSALAPPTRRPRASCCSLYRNAELTHSHSPLQACLQASLTSPPPLSYSRDHLALHNAARPVPPIRKFLFRISTKRFLTRPRRPTS